MTHRSTAGTSDRRLARRAGALHMLLFSSLVLVLTACGAADDPEEVGLPADTQNARPTASEATEPVPRDLIAYAGTGSPKFKGDGGPATEAGLFAPSGVALDAAGNLYVSADRRIHRVDAATGVITTVAGTGGSLTLGDDGPALKAGFREARALAVDRSGNILIADNGTGRIRRVDGATGVITTVAGGGKGNPMDQVYGDGGPATEALVRAPDDVSLDSQGNLYIATDNRIRKVDAASGVIDTVAGTGERGVEGDGGQATKAMLAEPAGVVVDGQGNMFIADRDNHRVRRVDGATGIVSTLAGIGSAFERTPYFYTGSRRLPQAASPSTGAGYAGDGGPAAEATLQVPSSVALDGSGNLFVADGGIHVRKVDAATGIITTIAGGKSKTSYETGKVQVRTGIVGEIASIAVNAQGEIFLADRKNNVVHKVSAPGAP